LFRSFQYKISIDTKHLRPLRAIPTSESLFRTCTKRQEIQLNKILHARKHAERHVNTQNKHTKTKEHNCIGGTSLKSGGLKIIPPSLFLTPFDGLVSLLCSVHSLSILSFYWGGGLASPPSPGTRRLYIGVHTNTHQIRPYLSTRERRTI